MHPVSVKTLLRATLTLFAVVAAIPLLSRAWSSWDALRASSEIEQAAAASGEAFLVMANIRSDRNSAPRAWASPEPLDVSTANYIRTLQDTEMKAFRGLAARLKTMRFDGGEQAVPEIHRALDTITRLQTEFWSGISAPASSRRTAFGDEYMRNGIDLQTKLEDLSRRLLGAIVYRDGIVDRVMTVKQHSGCENPYATGFSRVGSWRQDRSRTCFARLEPKIDVILQAKFNAFG